MHWNANNGKIYIDGNEFGRIQDVTFGGDSFDRSDEVLCSAKAADTCSFTVANASCYDSLNEIAGYAIKSDVSTIQEALNAIKKRIEELEKTQKTTSDLRASLRTLNYSREV